MLENSLQRRAIANRREVVPEQRLGPTPFLVPVDDLLTRGFVARHTRYASLEQLLRAGGLDGIDNRPALTESTSQTFDVFIASCSRYPNWRAMLREARAEWMIRRLGFVFDLHP